MTGSVARVMNGKTEPCACTTSVRLVRGLLLSATACTSSVVAQLTPPSALPARPPSAPPPRVCHSEGATIKFGDDIYRDLYVRTLDKVVSFEWRWVTPNDHSPTNMKAHTSEEFATKYWPTIAAVGRDRMFVGGKGEDGATILERWVFESKEAGHPAPSVELTCGALGAESPRYEWTLPPRTHVDEIVRLPPESPQGLIRDLFSSLRSKERVFIYYDGSSELYELDLATRSQTLRASPTGTSSSLKVPELCNDYRRCWAADYAQQGYCYFFAPDMEHGVDSRRPVPRLLVLIDSDRDGRIDSSKLVSAKEWAEYWGDTANFAHHDK
jgi:hypothetical protein